MGKQQEVFAKYSFVKFLKNISPEEFFWTRHILPSSYSIFSSDASYRLKAHINNAVGIGHILILAMQSS